MNIGARLEAVAKLVHAYLPVWLLQKGQIKAAVAADIAAGPCRAAQTNIGMYGLRDKIEVRMGSGLTVLKPGEADGAVIAGMGGSTIIEILQEAPEVAASLKFLIVQPMAGGGLAQMGVPKRLAHCGRSAGGRTAASVRNYFAGARRRSCAQRFGI